MDADGRIRVSTLEPDPFVPGVRSCRCRVHTNVRMPILVNLTLFPAVVESDVQLSEKLNVSDLVSMPGYRVRHRI